MRLFSVVHFIPITDNFSGLDLGHVWVCVGSNFKGILKLSLVEFTSLRAYIKYEDLQKTTITCFFQIFPRLLRQGSNGRRIVYDASALGSSAAAALPKKARENLKKTSICSFLKIFVSYVCSRRAVNLAEAKESALFHPLVVGGGWSSTVLISLGSSTDMVEFNFVSSFSLSSISSSSSSSS